VVLAIEQRAQDGERPLLAVGSRNPAPLDADRQRRKLKADRRCAANRVARFVAGQKGRVADLFPKVLETAALDLVEQRLILRREFVLPRRQAVRRGGDRRLCRWRG